MRDKPLGKFVNPPRPTPTKLVNGYEFTLADGFVCQCGSPIRAIDAEALDGYDMRLLCRCGHLILSYEAY
jgi:hypothetical protein